VSMDNIHLAEIQRLDARVADLTAAILWTVLELRRLSRLTDRSKYNYEVAAGYDAIADRLDGSVRR